MTALGNHEFDYGYDNLVKLRTAKVPILSANTLYNGKTAFRDNKIFTAPVNQDRRVRSGDGDCYKAHPSKIKGVTFHRSGDVQKSQNQVQRLKSPGLRASSVLGHLGIDSMNHRQPLQVIC